MADTLDVTKPNTLPVPEKELRLALWAKKNGLTMSGWTTGTGVELALLKGTLTRSGRQLVVDATVTVDASQVTVSIPDPGFLIRGAVKDAIDQELDQALSIAPGVQGAAAAKPTRVWPWVVGGVFVLGGLYWLLSGDDDDGGSP